MNGEQASAIFEIRNDAGFSKQVMRIFRYQAVNNLVYSEFVKYLKIKAEDIRNPSEIPFLPAEFFRSHIVVTGKKAPEIIFESSGTTGSAKSRHYVTDPGIYEESFLRTFNIFYGDPSDYFIAALLPSYTEREASSLVYMMNALIKKSNYRAGGFYRDDTGALLTEIYEARKTGRKVLLVGVSFALLNLAEKYSPDLSGVIVMETGGMKGRRKEITRQELHAILKQKLNTDVIHSEYGMTELLSQAYSEGDGIFRTPPWMKILIRDPYDPLKIIRTPHFPGGINIIDLANINSCSFIATSDLGKLHENGSFEVLGRIDNSDIRGCNLLIV